MMKAFSIRELLRWFLAGGAVVVSFFVALQFSLYFMLFFSLPEEVAYPISGFLMGLIVLAGSLSAPKQPLAVALVLLSLLVAGTVFDTHLLSFHLLSSLVGGNFAVAFIAWRFHLRHTQRSTQWIGIGVCAIFFVFVGVVIAHLVDIPAHPDELSPELNYVLNKNASLVTAFYSYDLFGFIDHESLWRIEAKPEVIELIVSNMRLRSTNEVPLGFWYMPPHYWPRTMPAGGEAFQSKKFSGDSRGLDGTHFFLVYDKAQNRAYVWVKDNF